MSLTSSAKKAGRIGLGPTMLMSPLRTFQSWGSSSSCAARSTRPIEDLQLGQAREVGPVGRCEPHLGVGGERAELEHRENVTVAAHPQAPVEQRASREEERDR